MKIIIPILSLAALALCVVPANAQFGPGRGSSTGPQINGAMAKLFGDHQTFTATMELETTESSTGSTMTIPGKMTEDSGKSRFEMNVGDIKGGRMPARAGAQLKAMGLDNMINVTRPDKSFMYIIYPGMQSYVQMPLKTAVDTNLDDYKVVVTQAGKETVDGHDCIKNTVVVTDKDGTTHNSTVWNATDLKSFPVKIQTVEDGNTMVMTFSDVSFDAPAESAFEPPAGYTKYDSMQSMMQTIMMKRMGQMAPPQ